MNRDVTTPAEAGRRIAQVVLARSLENQLEWTVSDGFFMCVVNDSLDAYLHYTGAAASADKWDKFEVEQDELTLVEYNYPSSLLQAFGGVIVPPDLKPLIDELHMRLKRNLFDKTYGRALKSLEEW